MLTAEEAREISKSNQKARREKEINEKEIRHIEKEIRVIEMEIERACARGKRQCHMLKRSAGWGDSYGKIRRYLEARGYRVGSSYITKKRALVTKMIIRW